MRQFSLRILLTLFAISLAIAITGALGLLAERTTTRNLEKHLGEQLSRRALILADKIDHALYERYHDIQLHASSLTELDLLSQPATIRDRLDKLSTEYEGYAWIGYANRQGKIIAANKGLLEGVDVSLRPWFLGGRMATFVGDIHRALLLEKKLNDNGDELLRFLDIAIPVLRKDGMFEGVLGTHIDWRWIKEITTSLPKAGQSEVLLVSANNTVLLGPRELQDQSLLLDSLHQAKNGRSGYRIERWPDGKTYLTGYTQSKGYKDYPGLGWRILERQEVGHAFAPITALRQQFILWGLVIAGLFAALGWLVAARIAHPLTLITQAAELLKRGQPKAKIPVMWGYREVTVLSRALSKVITELAQREAQLEHQTTHHDLTGLPNRVLMKALIDQTIALSQDEKRRIIILILDLDKFKRINDTVGYAAGNQALLAVADRLKECCIGTKGTLGHLGKDEFVLMLEEHDELLSHTSAIAIHLQQEIARPLLIEGAEFLLSASIGISVFPKGGKNAEALLDSSMLALHQAKAQVGNRIEFYESQMNASVLEQLRLERDLRQALERNELELHYQPQLSLRKGEIVGVEALLRWRHPELGMISPARFIPIAEASGLIIPVGEWVLNAACMQAQAWRKEGLPPLCMGVNVSVQQFSEERFAQQVSSALARSGLEPAYLKLEITESLLMHDINQNIALMHKLADLGVHLAIDDFGTGYSSLSYLKRFPIHELKIDKAFIRDLKLDTKDAAIVRAIISLGHNLKLSVIAEGVETQEQYAFLRQAGCDEIQGYYFSRPVAAIEINELLRTHGQTTDKIRQA